MLWEDRFHLVAYRPQPEVVRADTDTGVALNWTIERGQLGCRHSRHTAAQCQTEFNAATGIGQTIRLFGIAWGLTAVGDMAMLNVADVSGKNRASPR